MVALRNADPGTMGRRFMELLDEVRVRGQRGPLLLVASTSEPLGRAPLRPARHRRAGAGQAVPRMAGGDPPGGAEPVPRDQVDGG
ncbi:hypothetical protein ACFSTC_58285 [Nonomuraea ferruginea]